MNSKTSARHGSEAVRREPRWRRTALAVAVSALGTGVLASCGVSTSAAAGAPSAAPAATPVEASGNFSFQTADDPNDPTFNQLLGINDSDTIAGYFGSGMSGHPNKGYTLHVSFHNENYPGSAQTQVTGLNNTNVTVGFWVDANSDNFGFYSIGGQRFRTADYPTSNPAKTPTDQLLGVNDSDVAVGFYTDSKGVNHGYSYNISTHRYSPIVVAGDSNVTASAISDLGDVAGFATNSAGKEEGFLRFPNGNVVHLNVPGATTTQALGVNSGDEVAGDYTVGTGSSAKTYGFVWSPDFGFETVSDPVGIGSTTINGINDRGTLVGFYTDANGNTNGLVAKPTL